MNKNVCQRCHRDRGIKWTSHDDWLWSTGEMRQCIMGSNIGIGFGIVTWWTGPGGTDAILPPGGCEWVMEHLVLSQKDI